MRQRTQLAEACPAGPVRAADALRDAETLDERDVPFREKLALFRRASVCFGRSALMLSGAGSLGAFHVGVAKALSEQRLVPNVVSGASAGSIVAAIIGTHHESRLPDVFAPASVAERFEASRRPALATQRRPRLQLHNLHDLSEATIPDMTFAEAYEETGRCINVAVAPSTLHQRSRLLNASTSPNAFLREAVLASCAIPGVFPAVKLAARNAAGQRAPYIPSRAWVDGSITDDLPARRLARLYGVNHFITSQANPIAFFAVRDPHAPESLLARFASIYWSASRDLVRSVYPFAMGLVRNLSPINTYTRFLFSVMTQNYSADINIMLRRRLLDPTLLLARLSAEEAEALALEGERASWPKLEMIRNCTEVSRAIQAALQRLERRAAAPQPVATSGRSGTGAGPLQRAQLV